MIQMYKTEIDTKKQKTNLWSSKGEGEGHLGLTDTHCCSVLVSRLCPVLCDLMDQFARVPCSWGYFRQEYWSWLPCPPPGDLPYPGIKPRSPALQADSLPSKPPGKPKNIRVSSLSLLQGNFPTQELIWSLLHCRRILNQLSYQGSPQKHTI